MAITVRILDSMTNANARDLEHFSRDFLIQEGVVKLPQYTTPLKGVQSGTPDKNSVVSPGIAYIKDAASPNIYYSVDSTASENVLHPDPISNPRIDAVVLEIPSTTTADADATDGATIYNVEGAEAASPTAPTDGDIDTELGHTRWIRLYNVAIANPFVNISSSDITDMRQTSYIDASKVALGNNDVMYMLNASGEESSYLQQDSNDDVILRVGEENKSIKLQNSTGVDMLLLDSQNELIELSTGYTLRINGDAGISTLDFVHDGTLFTIDTNDSLDINSTGTISLQRSGVDYLQLLTGQEIRTNADLYMYPLSTGTDAAVIRMYDEVPNNYTFFGYNVAATRFEIASTSASKPLLLYTTSDYLQIGQSGVRPSNDNLSDVGSLSFRWDDVYATNGTIQTSDARDKDIVETTMYGLNLINSVEPVTYKWKDYTQEVTEVVKDVNGNAVLDEKGNIQYETVQLDRTFTRNHLGFIAQDVKSAIENLGGDPADFAPFTQDQTVENGKMGLRYTELTPVLWKGVQENNSLITALEARIEALESA